jgi:hypothetical protein
MVGVLLPGQHNTCRGRGQVPVTSIQCSHCQLRLSSLMLHALRFLPATLVNCKSPSCWTLRQVLDSTTSRPSGDRDQVGIPGSNSSVFCGHRLITPNGMAFRWLCHPCFAGLSCTTLDLLFHNRKHAWFDALIPATNYMQLSWWRADPMTRFDPLLELCKVIFPQLVATTSTMSRSSTSASTTPRLTCSVALTRPGLSLSAHHCPAINKSKPLLQTRKMEDRRVI